LISRRRVSLTILSATTASALNLELASRDTFSWPEVDLLHPSG
jgi:hypothetical protein